MNYYSSSDSQFHEIPKAPFYVLSNDKFMSGWGAAQGMVNTCVVPCRDLSEAEAVEAYARTRSEQKYVRIATKVRSKANVMYSLVEGWKRLAREYCDCPVALPEPTPTDRREMLADEENAL